MAGGTFSSQMKLFSRFILMARSLQGREDFNPGLELVPVIREGLRDVRRAGTAMLNAEAE